MNNIFVGTPDPLLSPANGSNYIQQIDAEMQRLNQLKQHFVSNGSSPNSNGLYQTLLKEIQSLNNDEKEILGRCEDYIKLDSQLQVMVNQVILDIAIPRIENTEKGKRIIQGQIDFVRNNRSEIAAEANKDLELFKKYQIAVKANPDLKYNEFIESLNK